VTQSHKTQWQEALLKSGLGARAVGTGLAMVVYANADGTRMWPAMTTLSEGMGCDRKYVTGGRDTLREYDWLTFVAKAVPNRRGIEFFPTFGRAETSGQVLQSEALEVSDKCSNRDDRVPLSGTPMAAAECPSRDDRVSLLGDRVSLLGPVSVPLSNMTMEVDTPCSKTMEVQDHECTGSGEHAWCMVEAEAGSAAKAKAAASAEETARAPDFD